MDENPKERSRAWVFTLNNYDENDINTLSTLECSYIIYGKEVAPSTGTPHLQGYIYFTHARRHSALKKLLKWWIKAAKGAPDQQKDYCSKDGDVYERGTKPLSDVEKGQCEKERYKRAREYAAAGEFDKIDDDIIIRHPGGIKYVHELAKRQRVVASKTELDNIWYWGDTGTGKSTRAKTHGDYYLKNPADRNFDGYNYEPVVIYEDLDKDHKHQIAELKLITDYSPVQVKISYGYMKVCPRTVVVTSNYHPSQIWSDHTSLNPIYRRFKIVHCKSLKNASDEERQVCPSPGPQEATFNPVQGEEVPKEENCSS